MTFKIGVSLLLLLYLKTLLEAEITLPLPQFKPTATMRGMIQFDSGITGLNEDSFRLRRIRTDFRGSLTKDIDYRINLEHANDESTLADSTITLKLSKQNSIVIGKTKTPIGLEFLQPTKDLVLPEFGLSTYLVPNRDIGIQFIRQHSKAQYFFGIFSGASDFQNVSNDQDKSRAIHGRVFFHPLNNDTTLLGLGIAGNLENRQGTTLNPGLGNYLYRGYGRFFSYLPGTYANGPGYRLSPQGYFYKNKVGLLTEYIISSQQISKNQETTTVANIGWQMALQYMLSNDKATYGEVIPNSPYEIGGNGTGAWQIGFRVGQLSFDQDAFPLFASSQQAKTVRQIGASLNWIWNRTLKWSFGIDQLTKHDHAGTTSVDTLVLLRTQITF